MDQSFELFDDDRKLIGEWITQVLEEQYKDPVIQKMVLPVFANSKSKKLRPLLILNVFKMLTPSTEDLSCLKPVSSAMEISHNASLLVDDVFDKDQLRRGKASFFVEHGTFAALSIAYNLSAFVFDLATRSDDAQVVREFGKAATALSSALYFSKDLKNSKSISKEFFMDVLHRKTSALFESSAKVGALMASKFEDVNEETLEEMRNFGSYFGTAYQLRDDVLAIIGTFKDLGKKPDSDITNRFQSLITIEAMRLSKGEDQEKLKNYYLKDIDYDHDEIRSILIDSGAVTSVVETTIEYRKKAVEILNKFPDSDGKNKLMSLANLINFESIQPYLVVNAN